MKSVQEFTILIIINSFKVKGEVCAVEVLLIRAFCVTHTFVFRTYLCYSKTVPGSFSKCMQPRPDWGRFSEMKAG